VPKPTPTPDPEVTARTQRRRFTAEYKRQLLAEADKCKKPGELGALLRREGLYSSHLANWRAVRDRDGKAGLEPKKRGPKAKARPDDKDRKIAELQRELAKTKARAERAEFLVDMQKKMAQLLSELPEEETK
jgi:transposase-like protein